MWEVSLLSWGANSAERNDMILPTLQLQERDEMVKKYRSGWQEGHSLKGSKMVRRKLEKPAFLVPSIPGNTLLWVTNVLKGRLGQNMAVHTCYQTSCGFSRYQSHWEWLQYSLNLDLYLQENLVTDSTHLGPDLGRHFKETPLNNHQKDLFSPVTT